MGKHWGTLKFTPTIFEPHDMDPVQPQPIADFNDILSCRRGTKRQPTSVERKVKRKRTGSKYKGVSWDSRSERWLCRVKWQKKLKYVGYFDSELEAARRHDQRARELYAGNLSAIELNFPDESPPVQQQAIQFVQKVQKMNEDLSERNSTGSDFSQVWVDSHHLPVEPKQEINKQAPAPPPVVNDSWYDVQKKWHQQKYAERLADPLDWADFGTTEMTPMQPVNSKRNLLHIPDVQLFSL